MTTITICKNLVAVDTYVTKSVVINSVKVTKAVTADKFVLVDGLDVCDTGESELTVWAIIGCGYFNGGFAESAGELIDELKCRRKVPLMDALTKVGKLLAKRQPDCKQLFVILTTSGLFHLEIDGANSFCRRIYQDDQVIILGAANRSTFTAAAAGLLDSAVGAIGAIAQYCEYASTRPPIHVFDMNKPFTRPIMVSSMEVQQELANMLRRVSATVDIAELYSWVHDTNNHLYYF